MKRFSPIFLFLFIPAMVWSQAASTQFTHYSQGGVNSSEFTTNNFKCVAVGKGNVIWAGTQYGGLYMYSDSFNIWRKSSRLTNVFINDIKADPDSGIWIAQSGQASVGGNSNIAGGVNYFPAGSDISMNFYSVAGTTTSADLLSRNAKALYLDPTSKAAAGRLPRPWVAQGTFITSFNTRRGGVSTGLNSYTPYFTNKPEGFSGSGSATPICESIGGNHEEVWVGTRQNGIGSKIFRYKPSGIFIDSIYHGNTSVLTNGFSAQAILFDKNGNRWVGLKDGGLRIKRDTGWITMNSTIFFPPGTQVNFNAMTEDEFGNVYIGTTNGLLMFNSPDYNPQSSPDHTPSYNHYTTANGLINNNVTGLAYDKKNGRILITSAGGVTFMNVRQPYIKGVVFNAYCGLDISNAGTGLKKKPFNAAANLQVRLLKDGVEEEFVYPDANGIFELKEANETDAYTVEIKLLRDNKTMKYLYHNIRNHTLLQPALMPDSLILEINEIKPKLEKRCFPVKLYFQVQIPDALCTDALGGAAFNTGSYDAAYSFFYDPAGLTDPQKRVDNLANYYTSLATVYKLGGDATELTGEVVSNLFDAIDAIVGVVKFGIELKKPGNADPVEQIGEDINSGLITMVKSIKDGISLVITKTSLIASKKETKEFLEKCVSTVNEVADLVIEAYDKGRNAAFVKALTDNLKKIIAQAIAVGFYKESYAGERHKYFVAETSLSAYANESDISFSEAYDYLYNPNANSLGKYSTDTLTNRKATMATLGDYAKYADLAANVADAATALALIPGGQAAAAFAKSFSFAAKAVKAIALGGAVYTGAVGVSEINSLSDSIQKKAGFERYDNSQLPYHSVNMARITADSLTARKTRYNQRLTELQAIYNAPYNAVNYKNKRTELKDADSLYTAELLNVVNALTASADTASVYISGFRPRFDKTVDSFVSHQHTLRQSLYLQNLSYILDPNKTVYVAGLDSLANEIKLANDSAVNGLTNLITDVNNAGIDAQAYLVQEDYRINHTRVPGSQGSIVYTFKNYGDEPQNNVSFKISQPTGGYTILGADSIHAGTVAPGQTTQVTFNFQAPVHDSVSTYIIDIKAANGHYKDVYGAFYVIDPGRFYSMKNGNWNDPATWSANTVPTASNSVYISHEVTVTANGSCKNMTVSHPGKVILNTGKQVSIIP